MSIRIHKPDAINVYLKEKFVFVINHLFSPVSIGNLWRMSGVPSLVREKKL